MTSASQHLDGVTAVICNYNGMDSLPATIDSLLGLPEGVDRLVVVDDGSTDGSLQWLAEAHPTVPIVQMPGNTGNLGKVRNAGLAAANTRFILLTDNDVTFRPGSVARMREVLEAHQDCFCATPRLLYSTDPSRIYQDGNQISFLGVSTGSYRGVTVAERGCPPPFATAGGGIMLFDRGRLAEVGAFDEGYLHAWADDAELQLRGALFGLRCLHVPGAVCLHDAKDHGKSRAEGQVYNRLRLLCTLGQRRSLLVMAPSLVLFEFNLLMAALLQGFLPAYLKGWGRFWHDRREILSTRCRFQASRRAPDSAVFAAGGIELPAAVGRRAILRWLVNSMVWLAELNWMLVRRVTR